MVLVLSQYKKWLQKYRIYAVFIFLSIALGPGLVINSVFKPYWGRPRPREVVELGGKYPYRPFYIPEVGAQGKSFPCGHCSVGFTYAVFFWIFLRRRKVLAYCSLAGSTVFGVLMGVGRIAAGGHFFSDVVWAGLISWSICFWLYYFVLRIPEREDGTLNQQNRLNLLGQTITKKKPLAYAIYTALGVLTLTALLLASPFYKEIELKASDVGKIQNLNIQIGRGNVELVQKDDLPMAFRIEGFAKGFGFPKNKVISECRSVSADSSQIEATSVHCDIHRQGFFSDYESLITIYLNPSLIENFELNLTKGDLDLRKANSLPANYQIHNSGK